MTTSSSSAIRHDALLYALNGPSEKGYFPLTYLIFTGWQKQ